MDLTAPDPAMEGAAHTPLLIQMGILVMDLMTYNKSRMELIGVIKRHRTSISVCVCTLPYRKVALGVLDQSGQLWLPFFQQVVLGCPYFR